MDIAEVIDRARRLQEQEPDQALAVLLAAAQEHDDEDLRAEIALFYAERGWQRLNEGALADFQAAAAWGECPLALAGEAALRAERGELEEAERLLERTLELDPELPQAHYWRGRIHWARGEREPALNCFSKAVDAWPAYEAAQVARARALLELERKEEAQQAILEGLRHCPYEAGLYETLGRFHAGENEPARARMALRRAVEIDRKNLSAWLALAGQSARDGDELEMTRALDAAAALDRETTLEWVRKEAPRNPLLKIYLP